VRTTRRALLVLLVAAIGAVAAGYYISKRRNALLAPAAPAKLPEELQSLARNWSWSHSSGDRLVVEARARDFRQAKGSPRFDLLDVELRIAGKTGDTCDLIRSKKAYFDQASEKLYSEGEVTIVLGLPAAGPPEPGKRYVEIRTSGLTYDNKTGTSSTDRPVEFQFPDGEGRSVGAMYDSQARYLWLKKDVDMAGRMRIRAGELHYREREQKIELRPWSKIERGGQGIEAGPATVYLEKGDLKKVEAEQAKGYDISPVREVRFSGTRVDVEFTARQAVSAVTGWGGAEMVSRSASGATKAGGGRVELEFTTAPGAAESHLARALVTEQARVENVPAGAKDRARPETRILTAETIQLTMLPGGEEIRSVETLSPGRLEFVPAHAGQWKRELTGDRITARYAPGNRIEALEAHGRVEVRSDPPASGRPAPPRLTSSRDLEARFDAQTGQMSDLRQWGDFRYRQGARQATANNARMDQRSERITLETKARAWDESGSTSADVLVLDQTEDVFDAEGGVTSTHQDAAAAGGAQKAEGPGAGVQIAASRDAAAAGGAQKAVARQGAMFASDRPLHATAHRMESRNRNRRIEYRGGARLWQEGSSIQAEQIQVDREARSLQAHGAVISVLAEGDGPKQRLVTITADALVYTDADRRAYYWGRVRMRRERMTVRASELEAFLRPQDAAKDQKGPAESRLERALARGRVEIVESAAVGHAPRRAYAEQAEYFSGEEKVILRGGLPTVEHPDRGFTRGAELTYWIDDDRLLVSGEPGSRSLSRQRLDRN